MLRPPDSRGAYGERMGKGQAPESSPGWALSSAPRLLDPGRPISVPDHQSESNILYRHWCAVLQVSPNGRSTARMLLRLICNRLPSMLQYYSFAFLKRHPTSFIEAWPFQSANVLGGADGGSVEHPNDTMGRDAASIYPPPTHELARMRRNLAPEISDAFNVLSQKVFADGALPTRMKQIIAVAVAHVTQCPYCIKGHTRAALREGASAEELMEAIWVAAEMRAGGAFAHSIIALSEMSAEATASLEGVPHVH